GEEEKAKGQRYRARFKRRVYKVFFGRNEATNPRYPSEIRARLKAVYPTFAKFLKELKRKNYRHSSHLLQNLEATVVIHRICGRVMRELPGIPLFTTPDSLLTTPGHVQAIKRIILAEFAELGVKPHLKTKEHR